MPANLHLSGGGGGRNKGIEIQVFGHWRPKNASLGWTKEIAALKNYDLIIHDGGDDPEFRQADLVGCLDSHTVVKFEKDMDEVLETGVSRLLLNLEQLTYISSAGISTLMGLTSRLRQRGGELVLLKPSEKVLRVFRTLGFTKIFKIVEDDANIAASFDRG